MSARGRVMGYDQLSEAMKWLASVTIQSAAPRLVRDTHARRHPFGTTPEDGLGTVAAAAMVDCPLALGP